MIDKNAFDFLRFFFAINILLCHLSELSQNENLAFLQIFFNAGIAVKAFFVMSGFLIAKSYTNSNSLKQYFIKRAKRILPAYVFVIVFSTIVLFLFSSFSFVNYFSSFETYKYVGWNLFFLNFMAPCLPGLFENNLLCAVNGALWTLKVEEGFYVLVPILFYFLNKFKRTYFFLVAIYLFSIIYVYILTIYFEKPFLAKQLPGFLSYFSIGILLYQNFNFFIKFKTELFIASIISFLFLTQVFYLELFFPAVLGFLVITSAYNLSFLNNFGKYGDFTYGVYIFHFPIIQIFKQNDLFNKYNPFLMGVCIVLITFIFALFSWFFIEKRFLDRYKTIH